MKTFVVERLVEQRSLFEPAVSSSLLLKIKMAALRGLTNVLRLSRVPFVSFASTSSRNSLLTPLSCVPTICVRGFHLSTPGEL